MKFGNLEWATYSENTSHAIKTGLNQFRGLKRKVNQYDLDKKFIKTWDSIADAQRFYNTSHISLCCKGIYKQVKGFVWEYNNENPKDLFIENQNLKFGGTE